MALINLTEEAIRNSRIPAYARLRNMQTPDFYWASSLSEISEHFKVSPPRKKDKFFGEKSAYIIICGLDIKRKNPDDFDEEDEVSMMGLDEGLCFPLFEIKDKTISRLAYWTEGDSAKYHESQERFGFNKHSFVKVPKLYLQYFHNNDNGWLAMQRLDESRHKTLEEKDLNEIISELMPDFCMPNFQPEY